jgi:arginase
LRAEITLLALPYDSGWPDKRMGRGPKRLLETGLPDRLRERQHDVDVRTIALPETFHSEGQALVALQNLAEPVVRECVAAGRRVLILSGNCGPAALSAVSALPPLTTGVVWFDAHGDFNTPNTSASGFLDGMALAILTGRCWPALAARFAGFAPVPDNNIIVVGARDLDSAEATALATSEITNIPPANVEELLAEAVSRLLERVENLYVHLDVDVLDNSEGCPNSYASPGGISAQQLCAALEILARSGRIRVAGITSYDPATDEDGRIRNIIGHAAAILMS